MNRAFIFDLDGVLINNEPLWEVAKKEIYIGLFGQDIYSRLGSTVGLNMDAIYEKAVMLGATVSRKVFLDTFYEYAHKIYETAPITDGIEKLGKTLAEKNYEMGIISASPREWMDLVINRLSFKDDIKIIISLQDRYDLAHKPEPDGYLEAIKALDSIPSKTIILEDSNAGIKSGKNAGAYVIGLKQNLVDGYIQKGADIYADRVEDVIRIIQDRNF